MKIVKDLDKNLEYFKATLASDDVTFLDIKLGKSKGVLVFVNDLVGKDQVGELILRPAAAFKGKPTKKTLFDAFFSPEKTEVTTTEDFIKDLLLGNAMLLSD